MISVAKYIDTLEKMFDVINEEIYENDLTSRPIFTIGQSKKGESGSTSLTTVWVDKETGELAYEINIASEYFNNDKQKVFTALLHECCHLFARIYGYTDTKNDKGINHTEEFKTVAEEHGLDCGAKDKKYGYGMTVLNEKGKEVYEAHESEFEDFSIFARYPEEPKKEREQVTKYKYTCTNPECPYSTKFTIKFQLTEAICECESPLKVEVIEPPAPVEE